MKHTITIEGRTVAIHERTIQGDDKQLDKTAYVHSDAQGSVSLVTDNSRAISFRNEYTPFGESIENLSGNGSFDKQQERGYTGHRMIASANVINMNARIYDPAIARFTSPDTVVPDTTMSMAHNRYIYVYNNPIKYVDPDGHCPICVFIIGAIIFTIGATSDDSFIHSVGTVVGSLMMFYGAALANTSAVGLDAFVAGAKNLSIEQMIVGGSSAGGASSFIASGGDIGETFRGAFLGGVGAAVSYGIGHGFGKNWTTATKALAHGVSQGIISELRGGEFKSGFIGGFLGKMTGGLAETMFDDKVAQYIAVTMIGGAVSEAAGGDFLDGAISAAMVHLFNDLQNESIKKDYAKLNAMMKADSDKIITLSVNDVKTIARYMYLQGSEWKAEGVSFSYAMENKADTIIRQNQIKFVIVNGKTYLGGEVNYIGIGAVNAAYGYPRMGLLAGIVYWNAGQYLGFHERIGTYAPGFLASHNITTIPNNYRWAFVGQYYGGK